MTRPGVRLLLGGVVLLLGVALTSFRAAAGPPEPPSGTPFADTQPLAYLAALDRVQVGDTASAMAFLRRTLRRHPTHPGAFLLYQRMSYRRRGADQTLRWVKNHLREHPSPRLLVEVLEGLPWSTERRLDLLRWGEKQHLRHPRLSRMRIRLLLERGRVREGIRRVEEALRRRPNGYRLNLLAGRLHRRRGELASARTHFRRAVRTRPGKPEGYYWLSRVHREQGHASLARQYRERFRALRGAQTDRGDAPGVTRSRR